MKNMEPTPPKERIDEETKAILTARLKDIDKQEKIDARQALRDIRQNLKRPVPR